MSSVHNVRNKFDCLQAIIYSLYYEEGECPTAGENLRFSRRALRIRLNLNQIKLN